ncbi:MAG: heparinase II/III-family protein, partial [Acidobacteriota bacterium]|nr:heparinase II/III-family protein [Acidobacteriota bacterium]
AHATLPGGEFNFDFGDIYAGNITRSRQGDDYQRERIDGKFRTNYNILYNLAAHYQNNEAQGIADWLKSKGQVNAEEIWTFIWYNSQIKSTPIERQSRWHYFPDHGVAYWRSSWKDDATAFAFKCGAPEGHAANESLKLFPDWRLSSGHAHPDAGSFIIWANGKYLTGDSGYAGIPLTKHHNTLVFDGQGQAREGKGHDAFAGVPYERLNKIRIFEAKFGSEKVSISADVAPAYEPEVGVKKFIRKFEFTAPNRFTVIDEVETVEPKIITSYLHADNSIEKSSNNSFLFESPKTNLLVKMLMPLPVETKIEKNILTAPGRPGSVDKGEREERGVRLAISTKEKITKAKLVMELTVQNR